MIKLDEEFKDFTRHASVHDIICADMMSRNKITLGGRFAETLTAKNDKEESTISKFAQCFCIFLLVNVL